MIGNWTARGRQDRVRQPVRQQPLLPGRSSCAGCTSTSRPTWACRPTSTRSARRRTTACCRQSTSAAIRACRRARSRRHDDEPAGHGQRHAGRAARTRCAAGGRHGSRSASAAGGIRSGSSRSPTSSRGRPATPRSSRRATSASAWRRSCSASPRPRRATIQPTTELRNNFFAAYAQDTWRLRNLTVNLGLRVEWENGISRGRRGADRRTSTRARSWRSRTWREAAYARAPIPQLAPADFTCAAARSTRAIPARTARLARPDDADAAGVGGLQARRKDGGERGYGLYYDTLNAADYGHNNQGYAATTTNTNSTDFGQTFLLGDPDAGQLGISDPFPLRADGTRFDEPTGATLGVNTIARLGLHRRQPGPRARATAAMAIGVQRELARNLSLEVAYDGSYSDRVEIGIRGTTCRSRSWIPGSLNARDNAAQTLLRRNVTNPTRWRTSRRYGPPTRSCISACPRTASSRRPPCSATGCCGRSRRSPT